MHFAVDQIFVNSSGDHGVMDYPYDHGRMHIQEVYSAFQIFNSVTCFDFFLCNT